MKGYCHLNPPTVLIIDGINERSVRPKVYGNDRACLHAMFTVRDKPMCEERRFLVKGGTE